MLPYIESYSNNVDLTSAHKGAPKTTKESRVRKTVQISKNF